MSETTLTRYNSKLNENAFLAAGVAASKLDFFLFLGGAEVGG